MVNYHVDKISIIRSEIQEKLVTTKFSTNRIFDQVYYKKKKVRNSTFLYEINISIYIAAYFEFIVRSMNTTNLLYDILRFQHFFDFMTIIMDPKIVHMYITIAFIMPVLLSVLPQ